MARRHQAAGVGGEALTCTPSTIMASGEAKGTGLPIERLLAQDTPESPDRSRGSERFKRPTELTEWKLQPLASNGRELDVPEAAAAGPATYCACVFDFSNWILKTSLLSFEHVCTMKFLGPPAIDSITTRPDALAASLALKSANLVTMAGVVPVCEERAWLL